MKRLIIAFVFFFTLFIPLSYSNYHGSSLIQMAQNHFKTKSPFISEFNLFLFDRNKKRYKFLDLDAFSSEKERSVVSGQQFFFRLRPYQDSYCYVFNIDSRNKLQTLFPRSNIYQKNPLKGNSTYYFPPYANKAGGDLYQFDYYPGLEKIYIVMSRKPIKVLRKYTLMNDSSINEKSEELTTLLEEISVLRKRNGDKYIKADLKKRVRLKDLNGLTFHPIFQAYKDIFIEKIIFIHLKAKNRRIDSKQSEKLKKEIWYKQNLFSK